MLIRRSRARPVADHQKALHVTVLDAHREFGQPGTIS